MSALVNFLSTFCLVVGLIFWFWGTWPLLGQRSLLFKLHSLSVADTLGSMAMIVGLLLQIPREWPLLILALISLAIWNTVLGYVIAYCCTEAAAGQRATAATPAQQLPRPQSDRSQEV